MTVLDLTCGRQLCAERHLVCRKLHKEEEEHVTLNREEQLIKMAEGLNRLVAQMCSFKISDHKLCEAELSSDASTCMSVCISVYVRG